MGAIPIHKVTLTSQMREQDFSVSQVIEIVEHPLVIKNTNLQTI